MAKFNESLTLHCWYYFEIQNKNNIAKQAQFLLDYDKFTSAQFNHVQWFTLNIIELDIFKPVKNQCIKSSSNTDSICKYVHFLMLADCNTFVPELAAKYASPAFLARALFIGPLGLDESTLFPNLLYRILPIDFSDEIKNWNIYFRRIEELQREVLKTFYKCWLRRKWKPKYWRSESKMWIADKATWAENVKMK